MVPALASARFGALLTPQGKIRDRFHHHRGAGRPWRRLPDRLLPVRWQKGLADKLGFYSCAPRLRSKTCPTTLGVYGSMGRRALHETRPDLCRPDMPALGWRVLVPRGTCAEGRRSRSARNWSRVGADDAHRIATGVPRGGLDFIYGDAFPHETNMDRLHGVDFDKGCYVGQEVVSRMQIAVPRAPERFGLRSTVRPRSPAPLWWRATSRSAPWALPQVTPVSHCSGPTGAIDALDAGTPLTSGGLAIRIADPEALRAAPKQTTV